MTEAQAQEAIAAAFVTGWAAAHPTMKVVLGNEANVADDTWVRLSIPQRDRAQGSMGPVGSRRYDNRPLIAVQLYTPVDQGDAPLNALIDDVRTLMEGTSCPQRDGSGNPLAGGESVVTFSAPARGFLTDGRWSYCTVVIGSLWFQMR